MAWARRWHNQQACVIFDRRVSELALGPGVGSDGDHGPAEIQCRSDAEQGDLNPKGLECNSSRNPGRNDGNERRSRRASWARIGRTCYDRDSGANHTARGWSNRRPVSERPARTRITIFTPMNLDKRHVKLPEPCFQPLTFFMILIGFGDPGNRNSRSMRSGCIPLNSGSRRVSPATDPDFQGLPLLRHFHFLTIRP